MIGFDSDLVHISTQFYHTKVSQEVNKSEVILSHRERLGAVGRLIELLLLPLLLPVYSGGSSPRAPKHAAPSARVPSS